LSLPQAITKFENGPLLGCYPCHWNWFWDLYKCKSWSELWIWERKEKWRVGGWGGCGVGPVPLDGIWSVSDIRPLERGRYVKCDKYVCTRWGQVRQVWQIRMYRVGTGIVLLGQGRAGWLWWQHTYIHTYASLVAQA
jgi:hypothetical protein